MTEKKIAKATAKKVYKRPAQVQSVESGKVLLTYCPYSCGSNMKGGGNCGHY